MQVLVIKVQPLVLKTRMVHLVGLKEAAQLDAEGAVQLINLRLRWLIDGLRVHVQRKAHNASEGRFEWNKWRQPRASNEGYK